MIIGILLIYLILLYPVWIFTADKTNYNRPGDEPRKPISGKIIVLQRLAYPIWFLWAVGFFIYCKMTK